MGFFAELVKALIAPIADMIIADQTNQANEDMMHEQMNYNKEMLDYQNEYNSPANQMKRNKEAGLNPVAQSMASGSLQNSSASALPVTPIPKVNPMANFASDISSLMSGRLSASQAKTEDRLRELRFQQAKADNQLTLNNAELLGLQAAEQKVVNQYCQARESLALLNGKADFNLKWAQYKDACLTIKEHKFRIENFLPEELRLLVSQRNVNVLQLDVMLATISELNAKEGLEKQETLTEVEKTTETKVNTRIATDAALDQHQLADQYVQYYQSLVNEVKTKTDLNEQEAQWFILTHLFGNSTTLKKAAGMIFKPVANKLEPDDSGIPSSYGNK